jgi:DNA-binding protein HU-beta
MNQSELIEKVAQASELNQAAAGRAVKAVVNAILDALVAGDAVRVSGLGIFNEAARPAREGRNPQTGEAIQIAASKAVRFHAGKARQRCSQSTDSEKGPPEEDCTTKETRGAEVNFLSMRTAVPPVRPSDKAADGSIIFFCSGKIFALAAWGAFPAAYQQNHFCSFMQNAA